MAITNNAFALPMKKTIDALWTLDNDKAESTFSTSTDLLVLSCALHRLRTTSPVNEHGTNAYGVTPLTDLPKNFREKMIQDDYDRAETIRRYYMEKLIFNKLRGMTPSKFREDLGIFLNTDYSNNAGVFTYSEKFVGLAYKLPYFYDYDLKLRDIFGTEYADVKGPGGRDTKTLFFVDKLKSHRKRVQMIEYWFKDSKDNRLLVEIDKNNPLLALWDSALSKQIVIKAKFERRNKDALGYFAATGWKLVDTY